MSGTVLIDKIVHVIVVPLITLMFAAGTFLFMWGLVVFIFQPDNPEARKTGVSHMLWGFMGMVIIISSYGIIGLITGTLGISIPGK